MNEEWRSRSSTSNIGTETTRTLETVAKNFVCALYNVACRNSNDLRLTRINLYLNATGLPAIQSLPVWSAGRFITPKPAQNNWNNAETLAAKVRATDYILEQISSFKLTTVNDKTTRALEMLVAARSVVQPSQGATLQPKQPTAPQSTAPSCPQIAPQATTTGQDNERRKYNHVMSIIKTAAQENGGKAEIPPYKPNDNYLWTWVSNFFSEEAADRFAAWLNERGIPYTLIPYDGLTCKPAVRLRVPQDLLHKIDPPV